MGSRMVLQVSPALVIALVLGSFTLSPAASPHTTVAGDLVPRWTRPKPAHTEWREGWYRNLVVVKFAEGSMVRLRSGELVSLNGTPVNRLHQCLAEFGLPDIRRLFSRPEETLDQERLVGQVQSGRALADLNLYYLLAAQPGVDTEALVDALNALAVVELAYFEPVVHRGRFHDAGGRGGDPGNRPSQLRPVSSTHFSSTPDFEPYQKYLDPAPEGLSAAFAWDFPGGRGEGIRFADVERGWNTLHEDLKAAEICFGEPVFMDHGTAVLGEVLAGHNGYGVSGIAPEVDLGFSAFNYDPPFPVIADAINRLMDFLGPGDVFLVEWHAQGPPSGETCECSCNSFEFVPLEYWQANFDAIAATTASGIVCVALAGNGSMDLDHPRYQGAFSRAVRDSGAVLVGASVPDTRVPTCWTNHGSRVDLHGYGIGVVTTGYGFLYFGGPTATYTYGFGGTSAASAMVAGCCCSVQGYYKTRTGQTMTSMQLRSWLASTGTPQAPDDRWIGPRPNVEKALSSAPYWKE